MMGKFGSFGRSVVDVYSEVAERAQTPTMQRPEGAPSGLTNRERLKAQKQAAQAGLYDVEDWTQPSVSWVGPIIGAAVLGAVGYGVYTYWK